MIFVLSSCIVMDMFSSLTRRRHQYSLNGAEKQLDRLLDEVSHVETGGARWSQAKAGGAW